MVFDKLTRKRIRAAGGKEVEIPWPQGAVVEPQKGHLYTLQSASNRAGEDKILVVAVREVGDGWAAAVRLDADPHRPLHLKAQKAPDAEPTTGPQFRPEQEPEQVSERYQRLLDEEGRLKTAQLGARQRQRQKALDREFEAADQRRRGKSGRLADAAAKRARKRGQRGDD
jgi:hypothetical protein